MHEIHWLILQSIGHYKFIQRVYSKNLPVSFYNWKWFPYTVLESCLCYFMYYFQSYTSNKNSQNTIKKLKNIYVCIHMCVCVKLMLKTIWIPNVWILWDYWRNKALRETHLRKTVLWQKVFKPRESFNIFYMTQSLYI